MLYTSPDSIDRKIRCCTHDCYEQPPPHPVIKMTDRLTNKLPSGLSTALRENPSKTVLLFLCLFVYSLWVGGLSWQAIEKGSSGFRVEAIQDSFLVSKVDNDLNTLQEGDRIIQAGGLNYSQILSYLLSPGRHQPSDTITFIRNDQRHTITLKYARLSLLGFIQELGPHLFLASTMVILGSISLLLASSEQPSWLFMMTFFLFSLIIINDFPTHLGIIEPGLQSFKFFTLTIISWLAFSSWAHFCLRFPVERAFFTDKPFIISLIYIIPPLVAIVGSLLVAGFSSEFFGVLQRLRVWCVPLIIIGSWIKHLNDYRVLTDNPIARNQMKLLVIGGFTGISCYLFLYLLPSILLNAPLISFRVVIFTGTLIPLTLFLAMIRYRLLDVDWFLSRSITYTTLFALLLVSYSGLLTLLKPIEETSALLSQQLILIYLLIMVVVFNPLKQRMQAIVDRIFFRDLQNYQATLHDFSTKVTKVIQMPELINLIVDEMPQAFNLQRACLLILEGKKSRLYPEHLRFGRRPWSTSPLVSRLESKNNYFPCQPDSDNPELNNDLKELHDNGYVIVFALKSGSSLHGLLCLGSKDKGGFFATQEIHALSVLANQITISLENSLHYESLLKSKKQIQNMFGKVIQAEKMAAIGEMTTILAHEIKNPLSIIKSSAQYLNKATRDEKTQQELLDYIVEEVDTLNLTINNMMNLARYKPPKIQKIDIRKEIDSCLNHWKHSDDHNSSVAISFHCPPAKTIIHADKNQLEQVFMNILRNSEEGMTSGGEITINAVADPDNKGVTLFFQDNGPGISPELCEKIFEKFFTTKEKGIGLGLPICSQIIGAHNGTFEVANTIGSKGVTVKIWLPRNPYANMNRRHEEKTNLNH